MYKYAAEYARAFGVPKIFEQTFNQIVNTIEGLNILTTIARHWLSDVVQSFVTWFSLRMPDCLYVSELMSQVCYITMVGVCNIRKRADLEFLSKQCCNHLTVKLAHMVGGYLWLLEHK